MLWNNSVRTANQNTCICSFQSSDTDLRWSLDKPSTDSAGGIYQYDNYDEVAMDTDSETNSPGKIYTYLIRWLTKRIVKR